MSAHEQDLNETIAVLNARLESRHIEATEQSGQIGDLKRELAEVREKLSNAVVQADAHFTTYLEEVAKRDALKVMVERVERLRDKWLAWPEDDMHYAAGLMLDRHLSGEAFSLDTLSTPESLESAEGVGCPECRTRRARNVPGFMCSACRTLYPALGSPVRLPAPETLGDES
jgi:hypothetical protein